MKGIVPPFIDGIVPPGDYELTIQELRDSILVRGDGAQPDWDGAWRLRLVNNLEILVRQLAQVGLSVIFADGSFVSDKGVPRDIDGYFEVTPRLQDYLDGTVQRELNSLDGDEIWTWGRYDRRPHPDTPDKKQLPMWHKYRVELFPHVPGLSAHVDEQGNMFEFPAFFRRTRPDPATGLHRPRGSSGLED